MGKMEAFVHSGFLFCVSLKHMDNVSQYMLCSIFLLFFILDFCLSDKKAQYSKKINPDFLEASDFIWYVAVFQM